MKYSHKTFKQNLEDVISAHWNIYEAFQGTVRREEVMEKTVEAIIDLMTMEDEVWVK